MAEEDGCRRRMLQTRARRWPAMLLRLNLVLSDEHADDDEPCRVNAIKIRGSGDAKLLQSSRGMSNGCVAACTPTVMTVIGYLILGFGLQLTLKGVGNFLKN